MLLVFIGVEKLNLFNLVKSFFPIITKQYWFVTVYIVLMMLSPYLNVLLNDITKIELKRLLIIFTILFIIIPTFTSFDFYGNELIQSIYFYLIGGCIRMGMFEKIDKNRYMIFVFSTLILIFSTIGLSILGNYIHGFLKHVTYFYHRNSIFVLLFCIALFLIYVRKKECSNKVINYVASNVFAVYLIGDNNYLRSIIWKKIFHVVSFTNSYYLIFNLILSVLIIFAVCITIEIIRKNTIEKITDYFIGKCAK